MNAKAEGQVAIAGAAQYQLFGLFKLRRVAFGSANAQGKQAALGDVDTTNAGGLARAAVAELLG